MSRESAPSGSNGRSGPWRKLALLTFVVGIALALYVQFGGVLTLATLAEQESQLRELQHQHPVLVYGGAFLLYVGVTGVSLPGATILTLAYGWYFGVVRGVPLVSFAATSGATLAFLLSRFLFRAAIVHRFGARLDKFSDALEREGPFYLFMLRLIPAVPFFVINAVMGLTPIRTWTFWWVSQLGMLAGTFLYVYAGSSVPNLQELADKGISAAFSPSQMAQIVVAFVLLGTFPLIVRWVVQYATRTTSSKRMD